MPGTILHLLHEFTHSILTQPHVVVNIIMSSQMSKPRYRKDGKLRTEIIHKVVYQSSIYNRRKLETI